MINEDVAKEILVVEDNPDDELLTLRAFAKSGADIKVDVVRDGQAALDYLFGTGSYSDRDANAIPAVILLDLNLPDMSGYDVLKQLRVSKIKTPILILSGLAGIEDKVKGLGVGADDYMTKPFHKDELVARIHAIVRRSKGHAQSVIQTGDLVVNLDTKTVEVGGQRVHLTGKEYQMLELLSLRKGTTLTKEMFLNHLYGGMDEPELKIIDVFICKLRKKLANASEGRNFIETVWGRGYVLREPHEAEERIPA